MPKSIPTLCGSIMGEPFSLGAKIHNAAYQALGLDYSFVCFGVEDPVAAVQAIRTLGVRGMNVSMPYKSAVMPHLDAIDESARVIGAVNTIVNDSGVLTGYNTDAAGFLQPLLEKDFEPRGKRVVVLGAGGAARGITFALAARGASIFERSPVRRITFDRKTAEVTTAGGTSARALATARGQ